MASQRYWRGARPLLTPTLQRPMVEVKVTEMKEGRRGGLSLPQFLAPMAYV